MNRRIFELIAACCLVSLNVYGSAPLSPPNSGLRQSSSDINALETLANNGDMAAQRTLGLLHARGRLVPKDDARAAHWLKKAAEQDDPHAQYALAILFRQGAGVPKDTDQTEYWLLRSARHGYARAEGQLGLLYSLPGPKQDYRKALEWFAKAAEKGDVSAQIMLAVMYLEGRGIEQNYEQALYWLTKAAEQNDPFAQVNLALMYIQGQGTAVDTVAAYQWAFLATKTDNARTKKAAEEVCELLVTQMSPDQINKAQENARRWIAEKHRTPGLFETDINLID